VEPRRWHVLSIICAGVFLAAIDFYVVTVAVPDMLRSFSHAGITEISWVFNGYTITFTAALLPAGGLADRFGRRRVFLIGLGMFSLGALGCAAAPSPAVLIAARLVQGIAGGTITPLALPLILPQFPAEHRGYAIGLWSATQSAAIAAGPSIGGVLVSAVGWRAVFLLQLPIGALALAGAAWALDRDRPTARVSRPPDVLGVLLFAPGIALPSLAIVQGHVWGALDWRTGAALAGGLLFGVAFVRRSLANPASLIDIGLLKIRTVRRASTVMLTTGLVIYALPAAAVLFLTGVWGYSEARAGLAVTPGPLIQTLAALAGGRLCSRWGPRPVAVSGAAALAACTLTLALATSNHPSYWAVIFPAVLGAGAGVGLLLTSLSAATLVEVPAARLASGTSLTVIARAAGAVVSLAALALILSAVPDGTGALRAYHIAWTAMAGVAFVTLGASFAVGGTRGRNVRVIQPDPGQAAGG
jgi:EmrB/QacA subfamily drug resistance transporter